MRFSARGALVVIGLSCLLSTHAGAQCTNDADCEDGVFCNGIESCDTGTGECVAISACPPFIDGCVTRNAFCDEGIDQCVDSADDSVCDDEVLCNGTESCDIVTGNCVAISACPPFIDGCVTRNAFCDEGTDQCVDSADDSVCDDEVFCNGTESCDIVTGNCVAISACPPFIDGCVTRNAFCDEVTDQCVDSADDSVCDDGVFCNGTESCEIATGGCVAISACPPFIDGCLVGGACDEVNDLCLVTPDDSLCGEGEVCTADGSCASMIANVLLGVRNDPSAQQSIFLTLDPDTGERAPVAQVPFGLFSVMEDMAVLDGVLWITTAEGQLFAININTGQPIGAPLNLTLAGEAVLPKGLTANQGSLYVGFRHPANPRTDQLGVASPLDGSIDPSSVVDFSQFSANFEGLGANSAGTLFSSTVVIYVVNEVPRLAFRVYEIGLKPPSYESPRLNFSEGDTVCGDLTFLSTGRLFCADTGDPYGLLELDRATTEVVERFPYEVRIDGLGALGPAGTRSTLRFSKVDGSDFLVWNHHTTAEAYDIVRGDLRRLRASSGDYVQATEECRADDFMATELRISETPDQGEGAWYLLRARPRGTYGAAFPSQIAGRDSEINSALGSCD